MTPQKGVVLVRGARQLLTLRGPRDPRRGSALGELGIVYDGSLLIRDGMLLEVGPTRRIENLALAREAEEIDATGRVVMPGFVDAHTHLIFPHAGGFSDGDEDDAPADTRSLNSTTGRRLELKARGHIDAMARHGTTTLEIKTGCGPDESAELKVLRVAGALDGGPLDVVPTLLAKVDDLAASPAGPQGETTYRELLGKARRRRLAHFADLCWSGGEAGHGYARRLADAARELGYPLKSHTSGSAEGVRFALESGAISADHLEAAGEEEIQYIAASGVIAVLLPAEDFHQCRSRYGPARPLVEAGAAVALGSNFNPLLTPTLSMQAVVSLACSRMHLTPAEAIQAATLNAAHALRRADQVGSLECGKWADLLILEASDYRDVAHQFGHNLVATTIKRGRVICGQGEVERAA